MAKEPCGGCGSLTYYMWQKTGDVESCNDCSRITDIRQRDAIGQIIKIPVDRLGTFSYATGEIIKSTRAYSDYLKKNGLGLANGRENYSSEKKYGRKKQR